jgi:2-polyprenyl-6-hydroxyphenyl methylase / 3-demethylubiquinone-9 3-methyltransferase
MNQNTFHGGSIKWWPPNGDLIFLYKANPLRFEYFDRFIGEWKDIRILDVGCGGGYTCEFLVQRGAVVFGTDIMEESLHEAYNHAAQENLKIEYNLCTAGRLPFGDQAMDVVTCFDVLEHIPDKNQTISEIYRVLKPGGWFFFDTFNKTFWSRLFIIWLGEVLIRLIPRGTHYWPLFLRPEDAKLLLEKTGFAAVKFAGTKFSRSGQNKRNFPVIISPKGRTSIIYFGAARKRI